MSAQTAADPVASTAKPKKKKNKKKAGTGKGEANGETLVSNGVKGVVEHEEDPDDDLEAEIPTEAPPVEKEDEELSDASVAHVKTNGVRQADDASTSERLDALAKERDALRAEVSELRKSLEAITVRHEEDVSNIQEQLEDTQSGKEEAESKYEDLRERVTTIRTTLGERLKEYSEEINQQKTEIENLEEVNSSLRSANDSLQSQLSTLTTTHSTEIRELHSRANISQQNWLKERDELIQREAMAREEFEAAAQAMKEWEDLANEERLLRKNLSERVADLEEEVVTQRDAGERAREERDTQSQTVEGLQRALKEFHDERKRELRDLVETSQSQLDTLRKQLETATSTSSSAQAELSTAKAELDRLQPLQQEIKEKNLLIGKLRHEAVTLNEHLTKALRFLKKSKPGDMVDRQLVTNHLLQFLAMERSDPKKFQVLQLIAALLGWSEEQKEQSGLSRPGAGNSLLRIPQSPFRRTPSTPSLSSQLDNSPTATSKESLAELWSDFLEREAIEGQSPQTSRRPSTAISALGLAPGLERRDSDK